jgi:CRP/FNR family transcriptional regulator, cyclic AMP receptor protein
MDMHSLESVIRQHVFFDGLEDRYIRFIASCAKNTRFEANQQIFREGEPANSFYFIREGLVSVELTIPQRGAKTVQTMRDGDVLGWSWLTPPFRWHFDARAVQRTHALVFDGKCLRAKCEEDHDLGYEILKRFTNVVTERLDATRLQLLDLYGTHA